MEEYTLDIEGMACAGCERNVLEAAGEVEGVHRVEVDHETGAVNVTAEADTEDAVRNSIHDAGYDVTA